MSKVNCMVQLQFSNLDRSLNRKKKSFKILEVELKSNRDDVIINLIIILNIKNIKLIKIKK